MNILFVVWTSYPKDSMYADPSVWYRCYQPAEAIRSLGHYVSVEHFSDVSSIGGEFDVVIFFRPLFSNAFVELFYKFEGCGAACVASYDDMFFDINLLRHTNFRGQSVDQRKILDSRPYNYAQALYFFDRFVVSTDAMRDAIVELHPEASVHVLYNALSPAALEVARVASVDAAVRRVPRRIGYFAGGAAHSPDLKMISQGVASAITKANAEFFCVETVDVPPSIISTGRVVTTPRLTYMKMIMAYATCCVTIAPLTIDRFTIGKSGIKYLEASSVGAVAVATPIPDIMRVADDRLLPVRVTDDWEDKLLEALEMPVGPQIAAYQQDRLRKCFSTITEAQTLANVLERWRVSPVQNELRDGSVASISTFFQHTAHPGLAQ